MIDTMRDSDGVGLAAPQVHVSQRLILAEVRTASPRYPGLAPVPLTILINPQIVAHSDNLEDDWEGCLSIPELRGQVPRWRTVDVSALDRAGKEIQLKAEGFFARILQHELDHLDGIVFLDRMNDLQTLTHLREFQKFWIES